MTPISTRILAGLAALTTAAVLTACSHSGDRAAPAPSAATTSAQVANHNAQDVAFAQMMITHHQQAVELSALVPDRSTNPAVIELAETISAQQQPEITAMKALLVQWEVDPNAAPEHSGHGDMGEMGMEGMVDDVTIDTLTSLKGTQFDTLWLQSMISHHQGAIAMADTEIGKGQSADMITMAKNIVTAQQAEIDQMKQMLGG